MRMYDIIQKKRNGGELNESEIEFFINGYTADKVPDYQASALLMAIYFQGMSERETVILTEKMANSGNTVDLSRFKNLSADKHSTGGVGDKTTLIVAPIVASLGVKVAKMSGRGLGYTGGTIDKLEAISGYKATLSINEFLNQVDRIGIAVIGQSENLAPADKKLYALRDVTATVESIPLISSSVMSKKIASGAKSIVLDVKVGQGAFMKNSDEAKILAEQMVNNGKQCGRNVSAVITNMDSPLGNAVGNSLEVAEAVGVLKGEINGDLKDISIILATEMTSLALNIPTEEAKERVIYAMKNGSAFEKMREWILAQGGDVKLIDDTSLLKRSEIRIDVKSDKEGYITAMDTEQIGKISTMLGAGRQSKDDVIDYGAGIIINKKTNDRVMRGDVLCTLFTNRKELEKEATEHYINAISIGDDKSKTNPLIYEIIR